MDGPNNRLRGALEVFLSLLNRFFVVGVLTKLLVFESIAQGLKGFRDLSFTLYETSIIEGRVWVDLVLEGEETLLVTFLDKLHPILNVDYLL